MLQRWKRQLSHILQSTRSSDAMISQSEDQPDEICTDVSACATDALALESAVDQPRVKWERTCGNPVSSTSKSGRRRRRPTSASANLIYLSEAPGPTTYNADDRLLAGHRHFPVATIGHGPGHSLLHMNSSTPGPGAFNGDDRVQAGHRRPCSATIGHGPGHQTTVDTQKSPGPAQYSPDHRQLAAHRKFPAVSFGTGPGHTGLVDSHVQPGPGSYNLRRDCFESRRKRSSSACFGLQGREHATAEERLEFRRADLNGDGKLDFGEIKRVLQRSGCRAEDKEASAIMNAVDRNHDGSIEFEELIGYTHSFPANRHLRDKVRCAFATSSKNGSRLVSEGGRALRCSDSTSGILRQSRQHRLNSASTGSLVLAGQAS